MWMPNYFDALHGGATRLMVIPAQFRSDPLGSMTGTLRAFDTLNLELYYLPRNLDDSVLRAAVVSPAPSILGASAEETEGGVTFSVNVLADGSAGIQKVSVLYTGRPDTTFYGQWLPLDLTQNPDDPGLWEGTLDLFPYYTQARDLLFMVQAVGGAGLTSLSTNRGQFYNLNPAPSEQLDTTLTLVSPPASGTYLKNSSFNMRLSVTDTDEPIADQLVTLDMAGQTAFASTDTSGLATITLAPEIKPDDYIVQASFPGNTVGNVKYLASNDYAPFTLNKEVTTLTVTPAATSIPHDPDLASQPTSIEATLLDSLGRPLGGLSVIFIVHNTEHTFARSVIADYLGVAPLGAVPLPLGAYTVDAYFSGSIPIPGAPLNLSNDYYESASALGASLTFIDNIPPTLSPSVSPNPVYLNGTATVSAGATDSGSGIASQSCGAIDTSTVGLKAVTCTATDNAGNTATATVTYRVIYRFDGFLQPINDTGHSLVCGPSCPISIFKGGSTVSVKFQLKDANGKVVWSSSLPEWIVPQMGNAVATGSPGNVYTDPIASGFTYSRTGQHYSYNWITKGFSTGYYWRIGVMLDDGQTYFVTIILR
jgi:hypothetical protein